MEPVLAGKYRPQGAPASQLLRKHGGRKSTGRKLYPLRSPANGRCQRRLGERLQQRSGEDGPRSSARRRWLERNGAWYRITALSLIHPQLKIGRHYDET